MKQTLDAIADRIISGDHVEILPLVEKALADGASASTVLNGGLLKGMGVVGVRFRDGDMFLPEVLQSARAMKLSMKILESLFLAGEHAFKGKMLIATVKGDIHDIGKNLVSIMLQGNGYEVIDLGINCTTDKFLQALADEKPDVCGLSAMLTTTMLAMQSTVAAVKQVYPKQLVIVGGAPVNRKFAQEIGADDYGHDAMSAVEILNAMLDGG